MAPLTPGLQSRAAGLRRECLFLHPLAEVELVSVAEEARAVAPEVEAARVAGPVAEVEVVTRLLRRSREPLSWCFPEPERCLGLRLPIP